jgi:hypothetical protein
MEVQKPSAFDAVLVVRPLAVMAPPATGTVPIAGPSTEVRMGAASLR